MGVSVYIGYLNVNYHIDPVECQMTYSFIGVDLIVAARIFANQRNRKGFVSKKTNKQALQ